jgi:hypothetical protein
MRELRRQLGERQVIADLADGRKEFTDNIGNERSAAARQMHEYKLIGNQHRRA